MGDLGSTSSDFCGGIQDDSIDTRCSSKLSVWNFSESEDYEFNSELLSISEGKVSLNPYELSQKESDFESGSHRGTYYDSTDKSLKMKARDRAGVDLNNILPSKKNNLIGYWRFDGSLEDQSASDFNLNLEQGSIVYSDDSVVGTKSFHFDGSSSLAANSVTSDLVLNNFTRSGWIKLHEYPVSGDHSRIISQQSGSPYWIVAVLPSGNLVTKDNLVFNIGSDDVLALNSWYHFAIVRDKDNSKQHYYLNGVLRHTESVSVNSTFSANAPIYIGGYVSGSNGKFNGRIDELSLWDVVLDADDIKSMYDSQKGFFNEHSSTWTPKWEKVEAYYKMDGNWLDSSGKNIHGASSGTMAFDGERAKLGFQAGDFSTTASAYVSSPLNSLNSQNNISFSVWVNVDSNNSWTDVISFGSGKFRLEVGDSQPHIYIYDAGIFPTISCWSCIDYGSWHHIALSADSETYHFFVDGILKKSGNTTSTGLNASSTLYMGTRSGGGSFFNGYIDDLIFWKTKLSKEEIIEIYERQKQKYSAEYRSPVIDLGADSIWDGMQFSSPLPFEKELGPNPDQKQYYEDSSESLGSSLVGLYSFDEVDHNGFGSSDIEDKSKNTNHGIETGGIFLNQEGILGRSAKFDGTDDFVGVPNVYTGDQDALSLGGWFKFTRINTHQGTNDRRTPFLSDWNTYAPGSNKGFMLSFFHNDTTPNDLGYSITINNGTASSTVSTLMSRSYVEKHFLGKWVHLFATFSGSGKTRLYINGTKVKEQNSSLSFMKPSGSNLFIGRSGVNPSYFKGYIDEVGFWDAELSESQVLELYRRAGNRLRFQIRTCSDSTCSSNPSWKGPGGDGTSFYSEFLNRKADNLTFNCGINTLDGDANICVSNEIQVSGEVRKTNAAFKFSEMTSSAEVAESRFLQYRFFLQSEENLNCSNLSCMPELSAVSLTPNVRYSAGEGVLTTKKPIHVTKLENISFTESASCNIAYQLSTDGIKFYYFSGDKWIIASEESFAQGSRSSVIESNIADFPSELMNKLYIRAIFNSDTVNSCELSKISINN